MDSHGYLFEVNNTQTKTLDQVPLKILRYS